KDLVANSVQQLGFGSLQLFVGDFGSQPAFAASLVDLIEAEGVNGVRSGIRICFEKARIAPGKWRIKRDLLGARGKCWIQFVARDQLRGAICIDLILCRENREVALDKQTFRLSQR